MLAGGLGVTMIIVAFSLWHKFGIMLTTPITFVYGCFMLLAAMYMWRKRFYFAENPEYGRVIGYWLASSVLLFATLLSLLTAPSIVSLPLYHMKTLSCLIMSFGGLMFAAKALKKKTTA